MYRPTLAIQKIGDYSSDEEVQTSLRKACKKRKKKPSLPGNARIKSPTSRENEVVIIEHFNTSSEERDEKRSSKNYTNIFCTEIYSGENEGTRSTKSLIKQSNIEVNVPQPVVKRPIKKLQVQTGGYQPMKYKRRESFSSPFKANERTWLEGRPRYPVVLDDQQRFYQSQLKVKSEFETITQLEQQSEHCENLKKINMSIVKALHPS